ncbi:MAG: transcription-repair coupling factor [Clostridia bacterium]|nr:transcription-repair coupling factor [Clostridia bacterium]
MLNKIFQLTNANNSIAELKASIRQGVPSAVFGVTDPFKNFAVCSIDNPVLYVVRDNVSAYKALNAVQDYQNKKAVYIPAKDENLIVSRAFSKDNTYSRIKGCYELPNADVIIVTAEGLLQKIPAKICAINFKKGDEFLQSSAIERLVELGFKRVESVDARGTFAVRGDVLDIFPIDKENPYRIDFFGDEVESIKCFDVETRKKIGYEDSLSVIQAEEFIFENDNLADILSKLKKESLSASARAKGRVTELYGDIAVAVENRDYDVLSSLASLSCDSAFIFDLLKSDTVIVFDEGKKVHETLNLCYTEFIERFNALSSEGEVFSFAKNNLLPLEELTGYINKYRLVAMQSVSATVPFFNPLKIINPSISGIANYQLDFKEVFTDVKNWLYNGYKVLLCAGDEKRAHKLKYDLMDNGITALVNGELTDGVAVICERKLGEGFVFHEEKLVVIGSGNLFTKPISSRKIKVKKQGFFTAPEKGDFCVHEIHGIGRVLGSKRISSTESTKDYIAVEYHGGDILYVPVEQMDILTRYLGSEKKPKLSKIGGKDFERIKKGVRESIKKMSFDLQKLYDEREGLKGYKFNTDKELQLAFNDAFPFEETPDQLTAEQEIFSDMQSSKVMDRLICGDVGFGKTEVAFRAVFTAIADGKQVAMLAPTTILTQQHYNTAIERFKGFGIKIACLNRFKTPKQQAKIIEGLKNGEIDFVIGTHRLLSKDVGFKDLGLLVLDEEQRFGVEHKERIKLLKKNVDAITLTATPIPRTLHMALSGIRSISTINTPPKKRLPVQTYVVEETDMLIRDAVLREVNRKGQVFILYNRVETIYTFAEKIRAIMPSIKITVAHGQMEERTLEKNIMEFYNGESDLLISTTIIENGIDLPKANTLIVIDADTMGLSTLYQLKGRVGRSDRLAYAYFTYKREKILTDNAFERLNAIIEFAEMGSGIKIAMRDLEIRGAGNVLGAEQHGHMEKIGYELYSKLLKEELSGKEETVPDLDIRVSAYIPESYIESNTAKMETYKEIAEISSIQEEDELRASLIDLYGVIPQEVDNLINIAVVKLLSTHLSAKEILIDKSQVLIRFNHVNAFANQSLIKALDTFRDDIVLRMNVYPEIEFLRTDETSAFMLEKVKRFLAETL